MEQQSKAKIVGRVGFAQTKKMNGSFISRFSVCVERAYKDNGGNLIVSCDWFSVIAYTDKDLKLTKGTPVQVDGDLRTTKYLNASGVEQTMVEVKATSVKVL